MSLEKLWDKAEDGFEAQIRRETRKRCLDEFEAFSNGEDIEGGVGSDVERVYLTMLQRHDRRVKI